MAQTIEYRLKGVARRFEIPAVDGTPGRVCTQRMLVGNLLREFIDVMEGDGDGSGLANYSNICLRHVWKHQEFAVAMTDMMHDAGDPSLRGEFRQQLARARLDDLFETPTAARLHAAYQQGLA